MRIEMNCDTKIGKKALYSTMLHFIKQGESFFCTQAAIPTMERYLKLFNTLYVTGTINRTGEVPKGYKKVPSSTIILDVGGYCPFLDRKKKKIIIEALNIVDFVIAHVPCLLSNYVLKIIRKKNIKYCTVVVGSARDAFWNHGIIGKLIALPMEQICKYGIYHSKRVIYVTKDYLEKEYPTKGTFINISNVCLHKTSADVLIQRITKIRNYQLNHQFIIATCAAVDVKYKGQDDVIKGISILKKRGISVRYLLAGQGDQKYLRDVAIRYDVLDQIEFLGLISFDKIFELLDGIDIYIQPSKQEGLPRSLIEAMSRGCLCIGSRTAGIPELLGNQWIFKAGRIEEIAEKILEMIGTDNKESIASINFKESQEYEYELLNNRRYQFFQEIMNSNDNDK